jgi:para-aminobenzoate synthetase/4-amino-4-deoxychorismate lyase
VEPTEVLEAHALDEVLPLLRKAEAAQQQGLHAIGWISYEASPAFDPSLEVHPPQYRLPYARFTLFKREIRGLPPQNSSVFGSGDFRPSLDQAEFATLVHQVHEAIAKGETYQVNLTYPGTFDWTGSPRSFFRQLRLAQPNAYQAYLEEPDRIILSASPELFFRHKGNRILCKPMKGTARPGAEHTLRASTKDQAENIMIVDMIRNDLGKIAKPGPVHTDRLFEIESYPSVVQMTSTISAVGSTSPVDWLCALFPCASITGAPKRKTMEWIRSLETGPRGIYTGCIGGFFADGETVFNVAIRTSILTPSTGKARYHTGCGIVWDSDPNDEYRESLLKTHVLKSSVAPCLLIETMRFEPGCGIQHQEQHLHRLSTSASILGFELDTENLVASLSKKVSGLPTTSRIRMLLAADGTFTITTSPHPSTPSEALTFYLDSVHTPSAHPELQHKTTHRDIYTAARDRFPEVDETLLINERGELMEFTIGNLVIEKNGIFTTPPITSGLLRGITRQTEIQSGKLRVAVLRPDDLKNADHIYLINAVRGWVPMKNLTP